MGCICSKGTSANDYVAEIEKEKEASNSLDHVIAPSKREEVVVEVVNGRTEGCIVKPSKPALQANNEENRKTIIVERPKGSHHQRRATMDMGFNGGQQMMTRIISMPRGTEGEQIVAGWPSWLTSVAGEAIHGWVPRSAESFEKLDKIGQGTYSSVYKARDLKTGKIVAMKKVRFVNMDPESVRFMAREIYILRKLNHPNVMKLEALVTSRMSCSLFLVFEYMEHDLAGLAASAKIKFTEPQIKCYMQQLLRGLEHCHSRGVLHRDIKGSNLLIDNNGALKIGDFGLATDQTHPLTSRVVTLWYRAPELLLGATEYGVAIDLWSAGCILAELFAGKPIMPGRTEVEQMHKIFKLCGSPSEEYWRKFKLPHATSFKPQQPYKRRVAETFKEVPSSALALIDVLLAIEPKERSTAASALQSEFFTTRPLPCDPSSLPKYPPSKELDAKLRDEEVRRRKAEAVKGHGPESVRRGTRESKEVPTPEFVPPGQGQSNPKSTSVKYNPHEDGGTGFLLEPPREIAKNGYRHSNSMVHPSAMGYSWTKKVKEDEGLAGSGRTSGSSQNSLELRRQRSQMPHVAPNLSNSRRDKDETVPVKESTGYKPKRNRIHCSGPLMPPGGNMEDMLKEHERQIQEAVRKSRLDKARTKKNCYDYAHSNSFYVHNRNVR